jgi:NADH-quinone oxidoreductase subunit J
MTDLGILFYLLAALIVLSTGVAVTRRNMAHAVVYLVVSFFGTALLFYLLGAPLLAALEVIIYAGAIMILFLFIVMMIRIGKIEKPLFPGRQMTLALAAVAVYLIAGLLLMGHGEPAGEAWLASATAAPADFGRFLFQRHWLAIEIASLLLLVALIGALLIGRERPHPEETEP